MQTHPDPWLAVEWPSEVLRDALAGAPCDEAKGYIGGCTARTPVRPDAARRAMNSKKAVDA